MCWNFIDSFPARLINGTYPSDINLNIVYIVYLLNTSLSYWLFSYLSVLITAHQRDDAISRINIVISTIMYSIQIVLLLVFKNYYIYLIVMPVFTIVNNIRTAVVAKKLFPSYQPRGKLSKEIKQDIKEKISGLMIQKVCIVSRNAFDSIFISMFLGLTETAMYNNYYYIITSITAIMTVLTNSIVGGVGNSIVLDTQKKNFEDMKKIDFWYMWIGGWFTCCLFCLFQPFMYIWVGKELSLPFGCMTLLCLYFYALKTGDIRSLYSTANGLWWKNRYRSIAEALSNIVLNYILGKLWGIYGIILATVLTIIFINFMYGGQLIFKYYFTEQKLIEYYAYHGKYFLVTILVALITFGLCYFFPNGLCFFVIKIVVCAIIPNLLYWAIYRRTKIFTNSLVWVLNRLPEKVKGFIR